MGVGQVRAASAPPSLVDNVPHHARLRGALSSFFLGARLVPDLASAGLGFLVWVLYPRFWIALTVWKQPRGVAPQRRPRFLDTSAGGGVRGIP